MSATSQALADTVRRGYMSAIRGDMSSQRGLREAGAALDVLVARLDEQEQVLAEVDDLLALYQDREGDGKTGAERERDAALARVAELERVLREADKEASIAHDAIWSKEVASCGRLHDNDDALSAQSAIWRLHEVARRALGGSDTGTAA